jgi:hypothetical protein
MVLAARPFGRRQKENTQMVAHWCKLGRVVNAPLIIFPPKNNLLATEMKKGKNKLGQDWGKDSMYTRIKDCLNQTSPIFPT